MGWYDAYKPTNVSRVNVGAMSSNSGNAARGLGNAFMKIGDTMLKVDKARDDEKTNKFINAYRDAQTGLTKEKTKTVVPESEAKVKEVNAQTGLIGTQTEHKKLENAFLPEKQNLDKKQSEANIKKTNAQTGYIGSKTVGQNIKNDEEPANNILENNLKKAKTEKVKKETEDDGIPKPVSISGQGKYIDMVDDNYYNIDPYTGAKTIKKGANPAEANFVKDEVNKYMVAPNSDRNVYNAIKNAKVLWKNSHKTTEKPKLNPKEDSVLDGLFKKYNL